MYCRGVVSISADQVHALRAWAAGAHPFEACGVLIGRLENDWLAVERVVRAQNRSDRRGRYDLDPGDLVAADAAARASGLEVVGIWHSHCDRAAIPSEADRRTAWSGWSYVILEATHAGAGGIRAWRLVGERFVEQDLRAEKPVLTGKKDTRR